MQINAARIKELMCSHGWSQNELARRASIAKGFLSLCLRQKRGVGRKTAAGLLRVFPEEQLKNLIIMENHAGLDRD